jgi:surfeit locus 1 family protein
MSGRKGLVAFAVFSVLAVALLASLGFWQLKRLAWKEALIAEVDARAHAPATPLAASWAGLGADTDEYRHVALHGVYDRSAAAFLFATPLHPRPGQDEPGFLVISPLKLDDGRIVLVERGFVDAAKRDAFLAADRAAPSEPIDVAGLLRFDEPPRWFEPADDLAARVFYTRKVGAIATSLKLSAAAPFILDADASPESGVLAGGQTRIAFPNNHLEYAVTWFGLAIAWIVAFAVYAWGVARPKASVAT